jgi:hypothetical protein
MEGNNNIPGNESTQEPDNSKTKVELIKARADIKVRRTMLDILNDDLGKKFKSLERLIDDCDKKTKNPNISLQRKNELLKKQVDLCLKANAYGRIINIVNLKLLEESSAKQANGSIKENHKRKNNNTTNTDN